MTYSQKLIAELQRNRLERKEARANKIYFALAVTLFILGAIVEGTL